MTHSIAGTTMVLEEKFIKKAAYLLEHSLVGKPPASVSSARDYALLLEQMIVAHCEVIANNPNLSNKSRAELVKFNRLAKELLGGLLGGHLKDMSKLTKIEIGEKTMFGKLIANLFRPSVKEVTSGASAFELAMQAAQEEQARLGLIEKELKGELEALQSEVNSSNRRRADMQASAKELEAARTRIASLEASIRVMQTAAEAAAKDEATDLITFLSVIQGVEAPKPAPVVTQEAPLPPLSEVLQQSTTNKTPNQQNNQPPTTFMWDGPSTNNQPQDYWAEEECPIETSQEVIGEDSDDEGIPARGGGVCPPPVIVGIKGKAMDKSTGPNPKKVGEVGDAFADIANIEAS